MHVLATLYITLYKIYTEQQKKCHFSKCLEKLHSVWWMNTFNVLFCVFTIHFNLRLSYDFNGLPKRTHLNGGGTRLQTILTKIKMHVQTVVAIG